MRCTTLSLLLVLAALHAPVLQAQQWNGSTDSTGTIYRTGNVGIGISPSIRLHVVESAANTPVALFENTNPSFGSENLVTIKGAGGPTTGSSLFRILRGATSIMHVRWDGTVGIGTISPGAKLDVESSSAKIAEFTNGNGSLQVYNDAGGGGLFNSDLDGWYINPDGDAHYLNSGGNVGGGVIVKSTGNVGIGINTPSKQLHVAADARVGNLQIEDSDVGGAGTGKTLWSTNTEIGLNNYYGNILFKTGESAAPQERMRIAGNGNVGIGTTNPTQKLEVSGNVRVLSGNLALDSASEFQLGGAIGGGSAVGSIRNNLGVFQLQTDGVRDLQFGSDTYPTSLYIKGNTGNIGIGVTDPQVALDVAGTLNADSILVNGQPLSATAAWATTNDDLHYMAGNVGIGTTTPLTKLSVHQDSHTSVANQNQYGFGLSNQGATDLTIGSDASNAYIQSWHNKELHINNLGNDLILNATGGDVGIGTSSPSSLLHLANTNPQFRFEDTTAGNDWILENSDGRFGFVESGNAIPKVVVASGGKVGIGVTDPQVALDIEGTIHARNDASSNFYALQLRRGENSLAYPALFSETTNGTLILAGDTHGNGTVALGQKVGIGTTDPGAPLTVATSDPEGIRVLTTDEGGIAAKLRRDSAMGLLELFDGDGATSGVVLSPRSNSSSYILSNVGIGTTDPNTLLELSQTASPNLRFKRENNTVANGLIEWVGNDDVVDWQIYANYEGANHFGIYEGDATNPRLHIYNGNVGIGTTNPTSKLAVNGTITSKEVIVTEATEAWPDFVFDEGYELRSLHEVEQFIETKGHLPEVPSAEEVAANGVAMGAMQATLLQKIEELTLYLIDMKQEVDSLRAELDAVKKK